VFRRVPFSCGCKKVHKGKLYCISEGWVVWRKLLFFKRKRRRRRIDTYKKEQAEQNLFACSVVLRERTWLEKICDFGNFTCEKPRLCLKVRPLCQNNGTTEQNRVFLLRSKACVFRCLDATEQGGKLLFISAKAKCLILLELVSPNLTLLTFFVPSGFS